VMKMAKCQVCGGGVGFKCPARWYERVASVAPFRVSRREGSPGEGYRYFPQSGYYLPERVVLEGEELTLLLTGTAQAVRIYKHYGVLGEWVATTTYAFYVAPSGGEA